MGKLSSQPEPTINHFSHPHPLQLYNYQPQQTLNLASCSGCKLNAAGWVYTCTTCNYILHIKCSEMPQQITHPFDQGHCLTLNPIPIYPEGCFKCDACGLQGNSFSYHCKACNIDLHMLCAAMPLILTHQSHHHQLNLTFSPPYLNKGFSCDICRNAGSNHWLYRCNICEFDAHLNCATTKPRGPVQAHPSPIQSIQTQQPYPSPIQAIMMQQPVQAHPSPIQAIQMQQCQTILGVPSSHQGQVLGTQYTARPNLQNCAPNTLYANNTSVYGQPNCIPNNLYANPGVYGQNGRNGQGNVLLNQVMQGLVSGASEAAGQILVQGLMGNGGGGGGNLFQGFIGGGNSGGVDGGGGGGGGVDVSGGIDGGSFSAFDTSY